MKNQLLLLHDVDDVGHSGELVSVSPGFARNYLLPQKLAVVADKGALRMQTRLKEERAKRAEVDRKEAEVLSTRIQGMRLATKVKIDPEGHMYGSVSAVDIAHLFEAEGIELTRRNVVLPQPIKSLGEHQISLRLKEGVMTSCTLVIESETPLPEPRQSEARVPEAQPPEAKAEAKAEARSPEAKAETQERS